MPLFEKFYGILAEDGADALLANKEFQKFCKFSCKKDVEAEFYKIMTNKALTLVNTFGKKGGLAHVCSIFLDETVRIYNPCNYIQFAEVLQKMVTEYYIEGKEADDYLLFPQHGFSRKLFKKERKKFEKKQKEEAKRKKKASKSIQCESFLECRCNH